MFSNVCLSIIYFIKIQLSNTKWSSKNSMFDMQIVFGTEQESQRRKQGLFIILCVHCKRFFCCCHWTAAHLETTIDDCQPPGSEIYRHMAPLLVLTQRYWSKHIPSLKKRLINIHLRNVNACVLLQILFCKHICFQCQSKTSWMPVHYSFGS